MIYVKKEGHCLKMHVDNRARSNSVVCNLSLGCDAVMNYQRARKGKCAGCYGPVTRVPLPRRSLQIMTGTWRYHYYHGIPNENLHGERRVSLTFRQRK
jgi:alkylated DNA repair dioxygenase AlkB